MIINSKNLRVAMFAQRGYLEADGTVWWILPPEDIYYSFTDEGCMVCEGDQLRARNPKIIPKVFPGYVQLQFIKKTWDTFYEYFEEYDLAQYKKYDFPVYCDDATNEVYVIASPMISKLILMLEEAGVMIDEFDSDVELAYKKVVHEEEMEIMKRWCNLNDLQMDC